MNRFLFFIVFGLLFTLSIQAHAYDLTLAWDDNSEPNIAGYKLYYKTGSPDGPYDGSGLDQGGSPIDIPITQLPDPVNPNFTLRGLDATCDYYFVATAYSDEDLESDYSNIATYHANQSPITDTGQTTSYTDTFGEDSDYTINPQSYTKLDENGNDLPDDAGEWVMVRDNVTGLIWEIKTNDGGIHDKDHIYNWYDAHNVFIATLNNDNFGGYTDWRLPTIRALSMLVHVGMFYPTINTAYFPNAVPDDYWSNTTGAKYASDAWSMGFEKGYNGWDLYKTDSTYVRAVRGGKLGALGHFEDNGDGTVTDTDTELMWQKAEAGEMDWDQALIYCQNLQLAGYEDWRLPNRNELQTFVDFSTYGPAINTVFPVSAWYIRYWSSTTEAMLPGHAWYLDAADGTYGSAYKGYDRYNYLHCVRCNP
ncbi:MAG: DUF1566 domain-containing protein [Deltaproteobacteria bacterium]|nr:DUF1566 domain-containing protein [Deltaproteobacteria bacterium]